MKTKLVDLASANSEVILDSLLENGLLKDIPILGNIVKALQLKGDISNYLFAKKLNAFITQLKNNNLDTFPKEKFDKEKLQAISSELVFIVERASNIDKSKWLAQAVIGLAEDKYILDVFHRLTYAINGFSISLIQCLASYYEKHEPIPDSGVGYGYVYYDDHNEELANLGLLKRKFEAKVSNDGYIPVKYCQCNLGKQLWYVIENSRTP